MVEKLKLILRRIHWSSLLRAAIFAAGWLLLPYWLFVILAIYLYFSPWFRVGRLIAPFLALMALTWMMGANFLAAVIFGVVFYLILLVKDLLILDRRSAYEVIVLILTLLYLRHFYGTFNAGVQGSAFFYAFCVAAVVTFLFRNFVGTFSEEKTALPDESAAIPANAKTMGTNRAIPASRHLKYAASWLVFVLISQVIIGGLFLPLDFIYQSVIIFLPAVLIIDFVSEYILSGLSRTKILGNATAVGALFVMILASARWGL